MQPYKKFALKSYVFFMKNECYEFTDTNTTDSVKGEQ